MEERGNIAALLRDLKLNNTPCTAIFLSDCTTEIYLTWELIMIEA